MAQLSLSVVESVSSVALTALGAVDWAEWSSSSVTPVQRKSGGGSLISAAIYGSGTPTGYTDDPRTISWTDGTPTASGSNTSAVYNDAGGAVNKGFEVTFPSNTDARAAKLYFSAYSCAVRITAIISDASTGNQVDTSITTAVAGGKGGVATVTHAAASAGQTVKIRVEVLTALDAYANVSIQAAWSGDVIPPPEPPPGSLRVDTASLISGAMVCGNRGLGLIGSAIASTGDNGPGYAYNDLSLPADADKEIRGLVIESPISGTFLAYEDTSFSFGSAPDGMYSFIYELFVDGVSQGTATVTLKIGDAGIHLAADITTTGWKASTGPSLALCTDDATLDRNDFVRTAEVTGTPTEAIYTLTMPLPAGSNQVKIDTKIDIGTGYCRVTLMDGSNVSVGDSGILGITNTLQTLTPTISTTGVARRAKLEFWK